MRATLIFLYALLLSQAAPARGQNFDPKCLPALEYQSTLESKIAQEEGANKHLQKLAAGENISTDTVPDFLFAVDLDDEAAVKERLRSLQKQVRMGAWPLARPEEVDAKCADKLAEIGTFEATLAGLQKQNAELKIAYFSLTREVRESLLPPPKRSDEFESKSGELGEKLQETTAAKKEIETAKSAAEQTAQEADSADEQRLAKYIIELETYRQDMANLTVVWLSELKSIVDKYDAIAGKLAELESNIGNDDLTDEQLRIMFAKAKNQWRTLIDDGFLVYRMVVESPGVKELPDIPVDFLQVVPEKQRQSYTKVRSKAEKERENLLAGQLDMVEGRFDDFYELLSRASRVRSDVMNQLDASDISIMSVNDEYGTDLFREIIAIPFRFFGIAFSKYVDIRASLTKGFIGFWEITQNLLALFILFLVPFIAQKVTRRVRLMLDQYRSNLLRKRLRTDRVSLQFALWIQRLTPYVPYLLYGLVLKIIANQITGTILEEIGILIPIIGYVIAYKIFRLLVSDTLNSLRAIARVERGETKQQIDSTSKLVGFFFLISYTILYLTEVTVDEGLLYRHVVGLMQVLGVGICAYAAYRWQKYIVPSVSEILPNQFGKFLSKKCNGKAGIIFCLPTLLIILALKASSSIWERLSEFEVSKKYLAKIYRKKIESIVGEQPQAAGVEPPDEYKALFQISEESTSEYIVRANDLALAKIKKEIDAWMSADEEDQSVALFGEKGIGKSVMLDRIAKEYSSLNVIRLRIPHKIWQKESLAHYFATELGFEKGENLKKGVLEFNKAQVKNTLILIDDAQNLFLGKYGGFDAFREFADIVNLKSGHLFWVSAFNEYSWAYIKGAMGHSQYLRTEVYLNPWSDEAIKELIMNRHERSKFTLSYDQMIMASRSSMVHSDAVYEAEEQFFRLLWEQSNGNPRVALFLWINCLNLKRQTVLKVNLPERPKADRLGQLDDNAWFVYAAIAKHENLTRNEAVSTTNLPWPIVAQALKMGIENKLLHRGEGNRYRLHFSYQYDLLKQLKMKNFIYGLD